MEASHIFTILISFAVSTLPLLKFSSAAYVSTITPTRSLVDDGSNATLVSAGQTSVSGFFSPGNLKERYLGIWYKRKLETVVWVANRNSPLTGSNGKFTIQEGNLVLLSSTGSIVWSSNVSSTAANSRVALLSDSGNLILQEQESVSHDFYLWQSFDYPSDSFLSGMKIGWDLNTGLERYITSWKSSDVPSTGDATFRISILSGLSQSVITARSTMRYRSGTWNGVRFSGYIVTNLTAVFEASYVFNESEAYMTYESTVNSSLLVFKINPSGLGEHLILRNDSSKWSTMYTFPADQTCESYNYCGANAVCISTSSPACECLMGFTPRSPEEWRALSWSKGCVRETPLDCQKGEGFVKIAAVKLPNILNFLLTRI